MGSYNSQYEDYYNSLKKKSRTTYSPYHKNSFSGKEKSKGSYWVRKITIDLIGVLILFTFVIGCKLIATPKSVAVYNYSKVIINKSYDYKSLLSKDRSVHLKKIQESIINTIEIIKSKVTGKDMVRDKIIKEFTLPLTGTETSAFGYRKDPVSKENKFHAGVDIDAKENTEVKAAYNGTIKECGEDGKLGKYILIDHGDGIETKYGHLNNILVKNEDAVKKSQVIAKSGNTGKSTGPHLHFELLYMGENKDPGQYFDAMKN